MRFTKMLPKVRKQGRQLLAVVLVLPLLTGVVWAQVTATITGSVKDTSGAVVPGTAITAKNLETGLTRVAETDERGNYRFAALPVGPYEVSAEKAGFKMAVRRGLTLVVGQEAVVDMALEVGAVEQAVTVTAAAPLVNTTTASTAGLISEQQVADLPLNGRSFAQLLTLTAGVGDYSGNASRNRFSVSGRRPDQNRYLIDGVILVGLSNGLTAEPTGSSGSLLGVEAVREFNLLANTYGAEYGSKPGGQITVITQSGTNELHGSAFEFLRNNALDARNFFDIEEPPPFRRNQFGGSLGGPILQDKLFLFGSYEGFRQRLGGSGQAVVPDMDARRGFLPIGPGGSLIQVPDLKPPMLEYMKLWREPNGPNLGGGTALAIYNPVDAIREDYASLRFDYNVSANDSLSGTYIVDDGHTLSTSAVNNTSSENVDQYKLVSLRHTRIFSPTLLNMLTLGYTRAYGHSAGSTLAVQIPANLGFHAGAGPGSITIGGGVVTGATVIARASGGGREDWMAKNIYTVTDNVSYARGPHSFSFGVFVQPHQQNTARAPTNSSGGVSYPTLTAFLQDRPTVFQGVPLLVPMAFRTTLAAWHIQDDIRLKPNLNLRVGLRQEMTSGYSEKHCRVANYEFDPNGIILTEPFTGCSALTTNNAQFLFQPRVGLAWDPTGTGSWSVRAGFSIMHDLQEELLHRLWNPPLNGVISISNTPLLSFVPIPAALPAPTCSFERVTKNEPCSLFSPGGVEPTFKTPTIQQWSLTIERQLSTNLMLRAGYVGSQDYHMPMSQQMNHPIPQICQNPAGCVSGGVGTARGLVPQGKEYLPPSATSATNSGLPNPYVANTFSWFLSGTQNYHGLDLSLVRRMSAGFSFRANYTFGKGHDLISSVVRSQGQNSPQIIWNRYNLKLNKGVAGFSLQHQFNSNFSYELPFGAGKPWGSGATGFWEQLIGGWQWNGIMRAQGGFPGTPFTGRNISGNGDSRNSDGVDINPNFTGDVQLGRVDRWFDPNAYALPIPGTFGNAGRGVFRGPKLFNLDFSMFKRFNLGERYHLQFRAEAFNVFNHTNFAMPNPNIFSGNNISPSAGRITDTATRPRNLQFALRLTF